MKTSRDLGEEFEEYVNEILNLKSTVNSGGSQRNKNSQGFDHNHERFTGESKVKNDQRRPNITQKEFDKLLKKAELEGYKDWIFFQKFGNKKIVMLDLDVFAELTYDYFHKE